MSEATSPKTVEPTKPLPKRNKGKRGLLVPYLQTILPWFAGLAMICSAVIAIDWLLDLQLPVVKRGPMIFGAVYATNLIRYVLFAGGAFFAFYVVLRRTGWFAQIQNSLASWSDIRREVLYSLSSLAIFAMIGVVVYLGKLAGVLHFYYDGIPTAQPYFWFTVLAMILIHDAWFYWTHRLLHTKYLYAKVHRIHHQSHNPTPWAAFAFHPVEAFVQAIILPIVALFMPLHPFTVVIWMLYMTGMNVFGHLGFELFPKNFLRYWPLYWHNTGVHHNMHHRCVNYNFGLYFNYWDLLFKTNHPDYQAEFERVTSREDKTMPEAAKEPA